MSNTRHLRGQTRGRTPATRDISIITFLHSCSFLHVHVTIAQPASFRIHNIRHRQVRVESREGQDISQAHVLASIANAAVLLRPPWLIPHLPEPPYPVELRVMEIEYWICGKDLLAFRSKQSLVLRRTNRLAR